MRSERLLVLFVGASLSLATTSLGAPAGRHVDIDAPTVSISDVAHVPAGQVHQGDIVAIFGDVRVEGRVDGQVVVILGSLDLSGSVEGDVVAILSDSRIAETARIGGELVNIGGRLDRASGSRVAGEIVSIDFLRFLPLSGWFYGWHGWHGLFLFLFLLKLVQLAALFVALLLVTALVPRRLGVIADAFPRKWGWALLAGLLAYSGVVLGCIVLAITLIGIPLAIALGFAMKVVKWLGLASILYLMGHTAGRNLFKRELPHLASVLGGFVVYSLFSLIPLFGSAFGMIMSVLAVGIAVLTRFGSEEPWGRSGAPTSGVGSPPPGAPPTGVYPPVSPGTAAP